MKPPRNDPLKTRNTLIEKVRRGDEAGWREFYGIYEKFIRLAARDAGLSREQAQDLIHDTMAVVRRHIGSFVPDAERARFRTWLSTIVRSRIADFYRRRGRDPLEHRRDGSTSPSGDETATPTLHRIVDPHSIDIDQRDEDRWKVAIAEEALTRTRETADMRQFQAFDLIKLQEMCAKDAARTLGANIITVRVWASRIERKIKRQAEQILRDLQVMERLPFSLRRARSSLLACNWLG